MNTKEYIASGVLEAVVLGSASIQEQQEVACLSKIYPEIAQEFQLLQESMTNYAKVYERKPSESLKAKIFAQMQFDDQSTVHAEKQTSESSKPSIVVNSDTKIMPLWPKLAIAASLFLAIFSGYLWNQNQQNIQQLASVKAVSAENEPLLALLKNPDYKSMHLMGVEKHPDNKVIAFWNNKTEQLSLMVDKLPVAPTGKQYQLWGIIDGKPADMGMIDNNFTGKVFAMKVPKGKVAAFAITLEKQGGSPTPTLEDMYVIGNV